MSMGIVLQTIRDHLRSKIALAVDQCDIRPGGLPPERAGEWYFAIDDIGVKSTARPHLREEYEIVVAIWRRLGQQPEDRAGDLLATADPYLTNLKTLDQMERQVVQHLHANHTDLPKVANASLAAGTPDNGDIIQLAMYYLGHAGSETYSTERGHSALPDWLGRRLRFAGMTRVQAVDIAR